ncbi:helix-turn-helix domain-containing protein [Bernardetia sp. Wsw4-3y2]|uniref:helix-turn-helix domain-containing protein n=1 Tax=Bernardetia sp. Wsw4-3y2 TaxID=3127471 RepID=UPI0030D2953C
MTPQEKKDLLRKLVTDKLRPQNETEKIEFAASQIHHLLIQRIIERMEAVKMTQSDLAKRMNVSKGFISQLWTGDKLINLKQLAQIIQILDSHISVEIELKNKPKLSFRSFPLSPPKNVNYADNNSKNIAA